MPVETRSPQYQTVTVGAACLVKELLRRLEVVSAIDRALSFQPEIDVTYGTLAQVLILNRMTFDPQPLYRLADWTAQHGIDRLLGIQASWLDDDRVGALLEALADQQVPIWTTLLQNMVARFAVDWEWLHADTTSVYFEGAYPDETPPPPSGLERVPRLVEGYNKDGQRQKVQLVLSLITSGRLPLWYRPWDGNQNDDGVYLADMTALRRTLLAPENTVLIGDCKLANTATMGAFCQQGQQFLAPHPWTETAKAAWLATAAELQAGRLSWSEVAYTSRNDARKSPEQQPTYRVVEIGRELVDPETQTSYPLRWLFTWSSRKAKRDARAREEALGTGEEALQRVRRLLGKYDYTHRATIERRIDQTLRKAKAHRYFRYTLEQTEQAPSWSLQWERQEEAIAQAEGFDGVGLLCTNAPAWRLSVGEAVVKYKEQVVVEQTIDFIKSPVAIRPMWLQKPKRLAGLTLLIMIAVLVAALVEQEVRRWIARTGQVVEGLMPEKRDTPYPTAKAMLRAFADYALVLVRHAEGEEEVHYPKLRPVQQQIWNIMAIPPLPTQPC
jgi:transposase